MTGERWRALAAGVASVLTVLSVAYPLAPVGPDAVGGAEQVLAMLDAALVAAGHRSLVVACAGSAAAGRLLPIPAAPVLDDAARARAQAAVRRRSPSAAAAGGPGPPARDRLRRLPCRRRARRRW